MTLATGSTDPERSVAFYEALGFEKRRELPIRDEAVNIFMGLPGDGDRLELTHNFGVDSYELGTGYGHIAVTVEDLDGTLASLAQQGIEPERPPYSVREGGSRLCFVRDPSRHSSVRQADGDRRMLGEVRIGISRATVPSVRPERDVDSC